MTKTGKSMCSRAFFRRYGFDSSFRVDADKTRGATGAALRQAALGLWIHFLSKESILSCDKSASTHLTRSK